MSWVEKTEGGRHRAVYRDDTGRRHSRVFVRKADAKAWLAAADTDRARGLWVDPRGGALPCRSTCLPGRASPPDVLAFKAICGWLDTSGRERGPSKHLASVPADVGSCRKS